MLPLLLPCCSVAPLTPHTMRVTSEDLTGALLTADVDTATDELLFMENCVGRWWPDLTVEVGLTDAKPIRALLRFECCVVGVAVLLLGVGTVVRCVPL